MTGSCTGVQLQPTVRLHCPITTLSLVSEQHNYASRSTFLQHLNPESFRINIKKLCPTILGCYYWNDISLSIRNKPTTKLFKKST